MKNKGFTFIELMIVITLIAVLAGILIAVIDPAKYFKQNSNAQRTNDTHAILNAVYQYYTDNNGTWPASINTDSDCLNPGVDAEICQTGGDCTGLVDLSALTNGERYLTTIPVDPDNEGSNGSGYNIVKNVNARVTVCAPGAEDEIITITR